MRLSRIQVWQVPEAQHKAGTVVHTVGFPASHNTYGGGFIYHMADQVGDTGLRIWYGFGLCSMHGNSLTLQFSVLAHFAPKARMSIQNTVRCHAHCSQRLRALSESGAGLCHWSGLRQPAHQHIPGESCTIDGYFSHGPPGLM
mgnify:CR=1 FL=1